MNYPFPVILQIQMDFSFWVCTAGLHWEKYSRIVLQVSLRDCYQQKSEKIEEGFKTRKMICECFVYRPEDWWLPLSSWYFNCPTSVGIQQDKTLSWQNVSSSEFQKFLLANSHSSNLGSLSLCWSVGLSPVVTTFSFGTLSKLSETSYRFYFW